MTNEYHVPALVDEVLHYLQPSRSGVYVDGTLGGGGHTEAILMNSSAQSTVIGFDMDTDALSSAQIQLHRFHDRVRYIHDNVANVRTRLIQSDVQRIQGLLLDLGVSSHQIDVGERGFSFQTEGRIDMRMNRQQLLDGWTVVNTYEQSRLADIIWRYGEERNARKIAKNIVDVRKKEPINTTKQLTGILGSVVGRRFLQKSLARVFQAIRIEVNGELENLKRALRDSVDLLEQGGRIVVISYHSLEDRIVKQLFKEESREYVPAKTKLLPGQARQPRLRILTKKPVTASPDEIARNPRTESAKLRAAERI